MAGQAARHRPARSSRRGARASLMARRYQSRRAFTRLGGSRLLHRADRRVRWLSGPSPWPRRRRGSAEIFNDLDALRLATGNPRRQFLSKGRQLGGARGARPRHFAPLPHIGRRGENPMCNRFCSINDWSEVPRLLLTGRRLDFEFNPERGVDRSAGSWRSQKGRRRRSCRALELA